MKTLWNILSFMAVVHLLALLIFVGWLWRTDRLDGERVETVRSIFAPTITEAHAQLDNDNDSRRDRQLVLDDDSRQFNPGRSSAELVTEFTRSQQSESRSSRRLKDEREQFLRQLQDAEQQIQEQREALKADRQGMDGDPGARQRRDADQLAKTVKLLESLPAKQTKQKIIELANSGRIEQAVIYLDRMSPRAAAKVFSQFKTPQENKLATELLERIRTLGSSRQGEAAGATKDASDAGTVANAS